MTTLTLQRLAEIEAAAAKATPGPWKRSTGTCNYRIYGNYEHVADCQQVGRSNRGRLEVADAAMSGAYNANYIALCDPATVAALCNAYRERDALAAQLTGYDAAREMLNVQDNKIDKLRSALQIARETIYSLDAGEIYDDELALIDAALAEGRS